MKSYIEVETREEGALIRAGLNNLMVRAFVKVNATLDELPSDRAMARVMAFVADQIAKETAPSEDT